MSFDQTSQAFARRVTRRGLLHVGALSAVGLSLPQLLAAESAAPRRPRRAKACILFFLEGGPSHIDLWDMKPNAPAEVRGIFEPIETTLPGVAVCEHLPLLSRQMHHLALIRSVHHGIVDHNAGAYYMLTGRNPVNGGQLIVAPHPDNFPPFGSVLAKFRPHEELPEFVHLPDLMSNNGYDLPGQTAGFLGAACDPLVAGDPSVRNYRIPGLELPRQVTRDRLDRRHELLQRIDESALHSRAVPQARLHTHYERAFSLLSSPRMQAAFDLGREPAHVRERYGLPDREDRSVEARKFGGLPHLGQCLLLSRRLIEAGVRLVTVCTGRRIDQSWDTHRDHFPLLKDSLLPYADRAFSALLEDLDQRGLLDETLVVAMGEFGRTPKLGQVTSSAGAAPAGRDHWPHCYTVMLAGAGIRAGTVHGSSDRYGAYPASSPVTPEDVAATIYTALGIDPHARIVDPLDRPHELSTGRPIIEVLAG